MTNRRTRRDLLALTGASLVSPTLFARPQENPSTAAPDLVVFNARVITVDPRQPRADGFAIKNGSFHAVGSNTEVRNLIRKGTPTWDAKGATVVPGFIDTHNHGRGAMLLYEVLVGNPFEVEFVTIGSIIQKLRARAAQTPPETWVEGYFFDDTKVKDGRQLTAHDLDQVSKDHPVAVHHRGGHTSFYNSKAFEMANVNRQTLNPAGGTFDRDSTGVLNGRVTDNANSVFNRVGKRGSVNALDRESAGTAHISKMFARYGVTSVHHEGGSLPAMQKVRANGDLKHRISYEAAGEELDAMIAAGIQSGFGDEWIRFGATSEHTIDGSFSERTMALSVPYKGMDASYRGNVTMTQDELNAWAERVHRAGIQINCHANGDVAIGMMLTAFERAQRAFPRRDPRPKITHCTLVNDDLLKRIKAAGAIPAPFTSYGYYNTDKFHFYGEELMKRSMAYRSFADMGIRAAAGSDFSPGPFAPLMGMQGMVTRKGWNNETWGANQRISVDEALRVLTINGAYASYEEAIKGSIAAGKLADFVVLAEDPHTVDPDKIKDIGITRTVTGGKTVYQA